MTPEDQEKLVTILADEALASNAVRAYFSELIQKSHFPKKLSYEAVAQLDDNPEVAAQNLVAWALTKGGNPDDHEFTVLGSLLYVLLPSLGTEGMQSLMPLFIRYQLVSTKVLLKTKEFQQHFDRAHNLEYANRQLREVIPGATPDRMRPLIEMLETLPDFKVCIKAFFQTFENPSQILDDRRPEIALIENQSLTPFYRVFVLLKLLLEDYVIPDQPIQRIADFTSFLKSNVDAASRKTIGTWLTGIQQQLGYQPIQVAKKGKSQSLDAYLMIVIRKALARGNRFHADAFLFAEGQTEEWLKVEDDYEEPQTLKKLPDKVSSFVYKAEEILAGGKYKITIEFFLPFQYWCEKVDGWEIIPVVRKPIALGKEYRLVLRAYERIADVIGTKDIKGSAILLRHLRERWDEIKNFLELDPDHDSICDRFISFCKEYVCNNNDLDNLLSKDKGQKIGLKIMSTPPIVHKASKKQREELFEIALVYGLPIVIWTRCEDPRGIEIEKSINSLLKKECLRDFGILLEHIKEARKKSDIDKQSFGEHLAILCDNPDRLPRPTKSLTG